MEGLPKESSELGYAVDGDAFNYISGLSTILVATIQEAKDRISQIEYVFCTQLYPHFQFSSKGLQKKDAGDSYKEKESNFVCQMENLQLEMKHTLEQNHLLQAEKEKLAKEYEEKVRQQFTKLNSQQGRINELETELVSKSREVDEGMELQKKLLDLVQAKASALVEQDKQLRECERRANMLLADLNSQERKVRMLQEELREKTQEGFLGKELRANLLEKLESQGIKLLKDEQLLIDCNKEKEQLVVSFAQLKENFGELSKELRRKTVEAEEARKNHNELLEQTDLYGQVTLRDEKQVENHEKEKELLLTKVKDLEEKVNKLQAKLGERCSEASKESDPYKKLLQQIESKSVELMVEKKKNRDLFDGYKRLKSQYNFLLRKSGLTEENMIPNKLENQNNSVRHHHVVKPLSDIQTRIVDIPAAVSGLKTVKDEYCSDDSMKYGEGGKNAQPYCSPSRTSNIGLMWKSPSSPKSDPIAGKKRPASGWRGTRSRECLGGTDPHDDFLDTPHKKIKGKLRKTMKEQAADLSCPVSQDRTVVDSSDDETQDMSVEHKQQKQQMTIEVGDKRGFKYVEPVRKKAEREKLRGYECKQCEQFYDAVLDKRGKDDIVDKHDFHCEHHYGVSRHRYRYAPPMTPEGFWNIGFESEM